MYSTLLDITNNKITGMKKLLRTSAPLLALFFAGIASAQSPDPDQNPNYAVSRDKYMKLADSVNQWHSTTIQQTYKAYDWYDARMERREKDRQFRRDLRLLRNSNYYRPYYNYRPYHHPYRSYAPWGFWWR
jgi:hypothetical protein